MFIDLPHDRRFAYLQSLDRLFGEIAGWHYGENGALVVTVPTGKLAALETWAADNRLEPVGGDWHVYRFPACNGEPKSCIQNGYATFARFQWHLPTIEASAAL